MTEQLAQRSGAPRWISWPIYVLLTLLMTWPMAQQLTTHLGGWNADMFNVYWGNWWVRTALGSLQNPYMTGHLIYPQGFNLATFAFSPLLAVVWVPLNWITSAIPAYNLLVWFTILFACVAMDELLRYLSGNGWAALLAGITFAFAPALVAQRGAHLNMSTVAWLPLAALLLTRLMREARRRDAVLLAVALALAFFTRLQTGALTVLFAAVYVAGLAILEGKRWPRAAWLRLLLSGGLALLLVAPLLVYTWQALQQPGAEELLRWEAGANQTDPLAYILPQPFHPLFGESTRPIYEGRFLINEKYWAYLGLVPVLLALYGAIKRPRRAAPWLGVALVFALLSLGPFLRFNGVDYPAVKLPYALAQGFFAYIGFDVPNRFNLAVMAAMAVLVGIACAEIAALPRRGWLLGLAAVLITAEYLVIPLPIWAAPPDSAFYEQMAADSGSYAVADYPLDRASGETHRYFQTIHGQPIVGGWDHRVPAGAFAFIDANPLLATWRSVAAPHLPIDQALGALAEAGVRYLIFHKEQVHFVPEEMRSLITTLKPAFVDDSIAVLPTSPESEECCDVVHRFGDGVSLTRPTVYSALPLDGGLPQLAVDACWLGADALAGDAQARLVVTSPEGEPVYEAVRPLSGTDGAYACQTWSLSMEPPEQAGQYTLSIGPTLDGESLGAYTTPLPIHLLTDRSGSTFPASGVPFPVAFDAPLELVGYHLTGGDGFLWADFYWRSRGRVGEPYIQSLHLVDSATGHVAHTAGSILHRLDWREGDLLQERRILWLDDIPQGEYQLGISLSPQGSPDSWIAASDRRSGERWPGDLAILDKPIVLQPAGSELPPAAEAGRIVAGTRLDQAPASSQVPVGAAFGSGIVLEGYSVQPEKATVGGDLEVTLYWRAGGSHAGVADPTVFVHLVDPANQMLAQHDGQPVDGRRPVSTWRQGDRIVDTHSLAWQVEGYQGPATLLVGLYDATTLERLPATDPQGDGYADDRAVLGELQIE